MGDDGLFDILAIEQMSTWKMLRSLKYLYNGDIAAHPASSSRLLPMASATSVVIPQSEASYVVL